MGSSLFPKAGLQVLRVLEMSLEHGCGSGERRFQLGILRIGDQHRTNLLYHCLVVGHFIIDIGLIKTGSIERFQPSHRILSLLFQCRAGIAVGRRDVQLSSEIKYRFLDGRVVRHHLLRELADLGIMRFGQSELGIVDINLVCGDDNADDLRIARCGLSNAERGPTEECGTGERNLNGEFHRTLLVREVACYPDESRPAERLRVLPGCNLSSLRQSFEVEGFVVEDVQQSAGTEQLADELVVARVLGGETALFEIIMRRYNQRLYRAARAIVRDEAQAEDVMQAAYVRAYEHLRQFSGSAPFGAWLTRIAVNEALGRLRRARHFAELDEKGEGMDRFASTLPDPEQAAATSEARGLLEALIDHLPESNRAVLMLRDVEGMSTSETAAALDISEENVKVRLHRARRSLRNALAGLAIRESQAVFAFHASRCDRVVQNVLQQLEALAATTGSGPRSC